MWIPFLSILGFLGLAFAASPGEGAPVSPTPVPTPTPSPLPGPSPAPRPTAQPTDWPGYRSRFTREVPADFQMPSPPGPVWTLESVRQVFDRLPDAEKVYFMKSLLGAHPDEKLLPFPVAQALATDMDFIREVLEAGLRAGIMDPGPVATPVRRSGPPTR